MSRREVLGTVTAATAMRPLHAGEDTIAVFAGADRVNVLPGRTYLSGSADGAAVEWSRESGPGAVRFAEPKALVTTATFTAAGEYVLKLTARRGQVSSSSTVRVRVEPAPPAKQLEPVYTKPFQVQSKFWNARVKALIVNWIPHCIDIINRSDVTLGPGGIDNFVEAGKKLRGEKAGYHKGYVFSNAWVHQTVEAMSIALMIDAQGDPAILAAQAKFRATLEDWIPKILSSQEPDGYMQTAFTLDRAERRGVVESSKFAHWDPKRRGDHEGYIAGYFLESAINHYLMTGKKDARLYNAAKKLADCWCNNLGQAPKKAWYDGHQEMEQALVRFGKFVNDVEGAGKGDKYIQLARFLLDCRYTAAVDPMRDRREYDQAHLPVTQQYEAVGHAVRASYTYSAMADVALETHDVDYQSAVRSLWDNIVNKKYYLTGGIGTGETPEGFGPNYSLRNDGYCESCSSCGMIFFHWKMNLAYHDARYIDNLEETFYNALLGSVDLSGKYFYYTNPLDTRMRRSSWHTCPCCVGNIPRTLLMMPTWAYAKSADGVYVNLYIGSTITVEGAAGTDIEFVQQTDYPLDGRVRITVNPKTARRFSVRLRVPNWTTSKLYTPRPTLGGVVSLAVNGRAVKPVVDRGYAVITREWKAGDRIDLELPLKVQRITAVEQIAATRGKTALRFGPLIYNVESVDQDITKALGAKMPDAVWRDDLLGGVMTLSGEYSDGSKLLAVPYYARANRHADLPPEAGPISADPSLYSGPSAQQPAAGEKRERPPVVAVVWMTSA